MALVELTGSVASWMKRVHDQLTEAGHVESAARFAAAPPFAGADPTAADYERLEQYVAAGMRAIKELLSADAALGA